MSGDLKLGSSGVLQRQFAGVFKTQVAVAVIASFFVWFWQGGVMAISLMSGGVLVGLNSILLARSVVGSSQADGVDGRAVLYRSAVFRFLLIIAALTCASLVGLNLVAVAAGMFSAYVGGYVHIVRVTSRASDESQADES